MSQNWDKLLFAHWPINPEKLIGLIPRQFEIDTFDNLAWIAIVPFQMNKVRFRYFPEIPLTNNFLELNVRTYIKYGDSAGVYFFSLDCSNFLAVEAARLWFGLPYMHAKMQYHEDANGLISYRSKRTDRRENAVDLEIQYRGIEGQEADCSKELESFLTERYCLFCTRGESVIRGDIHHIKWPLLKAEAEIIKNTMLEPLNIDVNELGKPILHYVHSLETVEFPPASI